MATALQARLACSTEVAVLRPASAATASSSNRVDASLRPGAVSCSLPCPTVSCSWPPRGNARPRTCLAAKRQDSTATVAAADELDEDLRTGLNEISNEAIRVMLADDPGQLSEFKAKVDETGEYLVNEGQMDAALFMLVIKGMLDHQLPEEAEKLEGPYRRAFEKIGSVLEDSGWLLESPDEEGGNVEMVDDELIPPVLRRPYN